MYSLFSLVFKKVQLVKFTEGDPSGKDSSKEVINGENTADNVNINGVTPNGHNQMKKNAEDVQMRSTLGMFIIFYYLKIKGRRKLIVY